jgi:uncharacterized protein YyaL (SSP411 family)
MLMRLNPYYEIVVAGPEARSRLSAIKSEYLPHALVVGSTAKIALPLFQNRFDGEKTQIFVCRDNVCQLPVETPEEARKIFQPE